MKQKKLDGQCPLSRNESSGFTIGTTELTCVGFQITANLPVLTYRATSEVLLVLVWLLLLLEGVPFPK